MNNYGVECANKNPAVFTKAGLIGGRYCRDYSATTLTVRRFFAPLISNSTLPGAVANSV